MKGATISGSQTKIPSTGILTIALNR